VLERGVDQILGERTVAHTPFDERHELGATHGQRVLEAAHDRAKVHTCPSARKVEPMRACGAWTDRRRTFTC